MTLKQLLAEPNPQQAIFDAVCSGLAEQDFKRSVGIAKCLFRGFDGMKCAIGHLIEDDQYADWMESASLVQVMRKLGVDPNLNFDGSSDESSNLNWEYSEVSQFLMGLMGAHDQGVSPREMKDRLLSFAQRNSLSIPNSLTGEQNQEHDDET